MARFELSSLPISPVFQGGALALAPNTTGTIYVSGTTTPIPYFPTATGGVANSTGSITTDSSGVIPGWVDTSYLGQAGDFTFGTGPTVTCIMGGPAGAPGTPGATGPPGPTGATTSWKGAWASGTTYALGDGVSRNGLPYVSNGAGNLGNDPATDAVHWTLLTFSPAVLVDSLSGTPRSVTDWGTILNAAIAAGTRTFIFGPFDYPFTTTIQYNSASVTLEGAMGNYWQNPPASAGFTRLLWNGTGSGFAIDTKGSGNGVTGANFRNLTIEYSSASFTGTLINLLSGGQVRFESVAFDFTGGTGGTVTASVAVRAGNCNTIVFEQCSFFGYTTYVTGLESGGTVNFSNVVHFMDCVFQGFCTQYALNPGTDWTCARCTFEMVPGSGNAAMQYGFTTNFGPSGYSTGPELLLDDCQWWDAPNASTIRGVYAPASGVSWDFTAINCRDHNPAGHLLKLYDLQANGLVRISGGTTNSIIDVGNATATTQTGNTHTTTTVDNLSSPSTVVQGSAVTGSGIPANTYVVSVNVAGSSMVISNAATSTLTGTTLTFGGIVKRIVQVSGTDIYSGSSATALLLNADSGHAMVDLAGITGKSDNALGVSGQVIALSHEQAHYTDIPTVAVHTGVSNVTVQLLSGNDMAGVIQLHNSGGVASATGLLADVTLANPPSVFGGTGAGGTDNRMPCVLIAPYVADDGGNAYNTGNGPQAAACQAYAQAKTLHNAGSQGAWSIGVGVGIPAAAYVAFAYRVVHL